MPTREDEVKGLARCPKCGWGIDNMGGLATHRKACRPIVARIMSRVRIGPGCCWLWGGSTRGIGYGRIRIRGVSRPVHRVMFEIERGSIPDGLTLDHLCRIPACCNPWHLEPVSLRMNILRGNGPPAINARKNCCINGHRFTDRNTYRPPSGKRQCRECNRVGDRVAYARNRERERARSRSYRARHNAACERIKGGKA